MTVTQYKTSLRQHVTHQFKTATAQRWFFDLPSLNLRLLFSVNIVPCLTKSHHNKNNVRRWDHQLKETGSQLPGQHSDSPTVTGELTETSSVRMYTFKKKKSVRTRAKKLGLKTHVRTYMKILKKHHHFTAYKIQSN